MNVIHKRIRKEILKSWGQSSTKILLRPFPFSSLNIRQFSSSFHIFWKNLKSTWSNKFKYSRRFFGARGKEKPVPKPAPTNYAGKKKFVKPSEVGAYSPTVEPIIQLENGYYLVYYHRQRIFTMFLLYAKIL